MRSKMLISVTAVFVLVAALFAQDSYNLDTKASSLSWHAEKVTGSHDGNVSFKSGTLKVKDGKLVGGSFEVDMTSLTVTDIKDPEMNKKLAGHLHSDDFFSTAKHKTAKFDITKVTHKGGDNYYVHGKMTIKKHTKQIKFPAKIKVENDKLVAETKISLDRTDYDVKYGSGSFFDNLGDKTIYDEFDLQLRIVAAK